MGALLRSRSAMLVAALLFNAGAAFAQAPVVSFMSQHSGITGSSVVLAGTNFLGTTAVQFGSGFTNAAFTVDTPTQITATVPAGALPGAIRLTNPSGTGDSPLPFYPGPVLTTSGGPVYPPPGGHTFSMTGAPNDGTISRAGGKTFFISNVPLADTRLVTFGPQPTGVRLTFQGGPEDILTFQPGLSNLPAGIAVWTGTTTFASAQPVFTRFVMTATDTVTTLPIPLVASTDIGKPSTIGALHGILPGQSFSLNHRFDASYDGASWVPALDLFDAYQGAKTSAFSSYSYGYYYDNTPPQLNVNTGLALSQGASSPVTDAMLHASDADGPFSEITFSVVGAPVQGTLFKNATPLANGGTFTQQDIIDGLMSYTHNNSCNAADSFQFSATDVNGGVMTDAGFTVFSFNVAATLVNQPPVPTDGSFSVGLGASTTSTLTATNNDCFPPTYTFAVTTPPTKGAISGFNPATGAFTYTATAGQSGADSFTFDVNDGVLGSAAPGTISITIQNQQPVVAPQSLNTLEDVAVSGTAVATDADLPPQTLTWSIGTNGVIGTAVINPSSGAFTYTPAPGRFGLDSFTVIADDGSLASAPETFRVNIRPNLLAGRVLITNDDPVAANRKVLLVNLTNSDLGVVAQSASFDGLRGVTYGTSGTVVVNSGDTSLYRVSGASPVLLGPVDPSAPVGPIGIDTEANGNFLVGQGPAGVGRYSPSGSPLTGYSGGNLALVSDVAVAANGDIYAADAGVMLGGTSKIVRIDPGTGNQTVVTSGGALDSGGFPLALVVDDANGDIYVAHGNPSSAGGSVFKVTSAGVLTPLASNGFINGPAGITLGGPNELIVSSNQSGAIVRVDMTTGGQTLLLSGAPISKPWGVRRIDAIPGQDYYTLAPCRVLDTRNPAGPLGGPALVFQVDRTFTVAGACGIPADAKAISLNIAVTGPTNQGNLRLHPGGTAVPLVSSINFKAGQTRSNNAVVPLSALGQLGAFLDQAAGTAHLIIDVNGYFK